MTPVAAPISDTAPDPPLAEVHSTVLGWYAANGRNLAFRRTTDPWAILVSEVMAQQTQAARAAEHWTRFMAQFPTPAALAAASPATVIRAWRGLGYNRRAVTLRAAAIEIVERHGGCVPDSLEALESFPGVGPYTARAVLVFAFDRPVAPLDTNIRRVLDRAFGQVPSSSRALQTAADGLVPTAAAATWSHALMDIGATICAPRAPRCAPALFVRGVERRLRAPVPRTSSYHRSHGREPPLRQRAPSRRRRDGCVGALSTASEMRRIAHGSRSMARSASTPARPS